MSKGWRSHFGIHSFVYNRQIGQKASLDCYSAINNELYSSIRTIASWNPDKTVGDTHHGSIFNFDFSADGSLLVAACERRSILMFDPYNSHLIHSKNDAHTDCVNCVRFLDCRTFATCSDDTTVSLWDSRYLKKKIRVLADHSNWVKNIDYAPDLGLLITSGFDGCINTWDINSYSDVGETRARRIFYTNGLMRSKLSPDASKLIMATASGYLMVVHDLDLTRLPHDLAGFKPNMYRLMQMSRARPRFGYMFDQMFTRKKNRVELISDFPSQDNAELISSLEVHPQGWSVCSRNTTNDESSEWTCVHDIQGTREEVETMENELCSPSLPDLEAQSHSPTLSYQAGASSTESARTASPVRHISLNLADPLPLRERVRRSPVSSSVPEVNVTESSSESDTSSSCDEEALTEPTTSTSNASEPYFLSQLSVQVDATGSSSARNSPANDYYPVPHIPTLIVDSQNFYLNSDGGLPSHSPSSSIVDPSLTFNRSQTLSPSQTKSYVVRRNIPRLTNYIEEPNVGRGFIKELCFSPDGRLICSPFAYGIRLLAFDSTCREMCDCVTGGASQLYEVASNMSHSREVVTAKFSPIHCLLVSGCLDGKVSFHQPVL